MLIIFTADYLVSEVKKEFEVEDKLDFSSYHNKKDCNGSHLQPEDVFVSQSQIGKNCTANFPQISSLLVEFHAHTEEKMVQLVRRFIFHI